MNFVKLLLLVVPLAAIAGRAAADNLGPPDAAAPKASCHLAPDGSITCIHISGYLSAGGRFTGATPPTGAFAPHASGFSTTHLDQEPQLGAALGSTRLYLDSDDTAR